MKRRICVVVTARPSYSRIRTALKAIRDHPALELQVVLTASALLDRYGGMSEVLEADGFPVAARAFTIVEGENLVTSAKSTGLGLMEMSTILDQMHPHAVVTIADRFETIATAVAAAYMNIPLIHVQGGEVTGSIDEKVRHAITKLADLHLVATSMAAERVVRMGEDQGRVFVTGCPSIDLAAHTLDGTDGHGDFDPYGRYGGVGGRPDLSAGYLVVLQHPVTTEHADARVQVTETLYAAKDSGQPVLWFWPNVDAGSDDTSKGIRAFREKERPPQFHYFKNMRPEHFLRLLFGASALVGNSSVGIRECSFLGVPVVNVGTRQLGRERGRNVVDVPHERGAILEAIRKQVAHGRFPKDTRYGDGTAGRRIAEIIATAPLTIEKRLPY